jgi:hypothetical protein
VQKSKVTSRAISSPPTKLSEKSAELANTSEGLLEGSRKLRERIAALIKAAGMLRAQVKRPKQKSNPPRGVR